MELLVAQGKVLYVGSSNFAGWHLAAGAGVGRAGGNFLGLVSEQCIYNLHDPARRAGGDAGRAASTGSASSRGRRCTAGCSSGALRKQREGTGGRSSEGRSADGARASTATAIEAYEKLCRRARRTTRPTWPWPGCCPGPASPRRSSARARWSSSTARCGALELTLDERDPGPARRAVPADRQRRPRPRGVGLVALPLL